MSSIDGWDWDYLWHFLGGLAINGILVILPLALLSGPAWISFVTPAVITAGGLIRENIQHDWKELNAHQWLEGVLWGIGAMVAAIIGIFTAF